MTAPRKPRVRESVIGLPAERAAYEASCAAVAADLDREVADALALAQERIAAGTPLQVVLTELWRGGYRSGYYDLAVARGDAGHADLDAPTVLVCEAADLAKAA